MLANLPGAGQTTNIREETTAGARNQNYQEAGTAHIYFSCKEHLHYDVLF